MTPPADHRSTLRALVEAGERFGKGEVFIDNMPHMGTIELARVGDNHRVQQRQPWSVEGHPRYSAAASFIARSVNARPALAAIAGKVWLEPEVVRDLMDAADHRDRHLPDCSLTYVEHMVVVPCDCPDRLRAALAAAEAELRATEERCSR